MPYVSPQKDPWNIPKPDSSRHYRWIASDPRRLGLWLRGFGDIPGYRLLQGKDRADTIKIAERLGFPASYVDVNNRITWGHNVLADIPREEYDRRVKERLDEQLEKIYTAQNSVSEAVDKIPGVDMFVEHPDETAMRKANSERDGRPFSGQSGRGTSPALKARKTPTKP